MRISENQFRELLTRYVKGEATQEEEKLLGLFFESYQKEDIMDAASRLPAHAKEEMLRNIYDKIGLPAAAARNWGWRIAAAVSLILVVSFVFFRNDLLNVTEEAASVTMIDESSPLGQKASLVLPDGTKVTLNSGSSIRYPSRFSITNREVILTGEAYFEVVPDPAKPFIIQAGITSTQVLGTTFNICAVTGKNVEVTLVEGSVKVRSTAENSAVLQPSQQAVIDAATSLITLQHVDVRRFTSWKDNLIFLENTSLKEAAGVLEKWYDVRITLQNPRLEKCLITAKYQDESLENVLKSLEFLLKVEIRKNGKQITINGKGC
jgi:transmembrane sensor